MCPSRFPCLLSYLVKLLRIVLTDCSSRYRDVIDTTPADGNVWKMLLGPINDWFDDD